MQSQQKSRSLMAANIARCPDQKNIHKALLPKFKGGFKFEVQRALKIDGKPLKVF